jgi:hypothetical protein
MAEEEELSPNVVDSVLFWTEPAPLPYALPIYVSRSSILGSSVAFSHLSILTVQKLRLRHVDGSETTFYFEEMHTSYAGGRSYFILFSRVETSKDRPRCMVIWNE